MNRLSWFQRIVGGLIVLLVAALTHLSAIILLPSLATKDAFDSLAHSEATGSVKSPAASGTMRLLAASRPGDGLVPFRDPATVQGVCFFDLSAAPFRIKTTIEEGRLLTLSFRTPKGRIFYSMTDRAAFHDVIDIHLVTEAQLKAVEAEDDEDQGLPSELRLKAPTLIGMVIATALVARPSEAHDAEERIKAIACAPEPLPTPS